MDEEKNLISTAASAPPTVYSGYNPWDETLDEMLPDKIPFLRISYPNARGVPADAPTGVFYNSLTGELYDTVYALLVSIIPPKQALWPETYSQTNRAVCFSENGWNPTGGTMQLEGPCRDRNQKGQVIERCPMLRWMPRGPGERDRPPQCRTTVSSLIWIMRGKYRKAEFDVNTAVLISTHSKANEEIGRLKSTLKSLRLRLENPDKIPVNFLVPIEITLRAEQAPKGNYYIPTWKVLLDPEERVSKEFALKVMDATDGLADVASRITVETVSGVVEEAPDGAPF